MRGRARQNKRSAGFSLVELVMVTAIIAIVGAIAAPRYATTVHRYRAETAARSIVAELTKARAFAREASEPHRVRFDLAGHRLTLPDQPPHPHTGGPRSIWLERQPYQARIINIAFDDGTSEVSFDGHGMPSTGGAIVIRSGQTTRTVTLHAVSGEADVD